MPWPFQCCHSTSSFTSSAVAPRGFGRHRVVGGWLRFSSFPSQRLMRVLMALLAIAWLQLAAGFLLPTLPHRAVDSRHAPEANLPAHWRNSPTAWLPAEEASVLRLARVDTERLLQELLCDDGEHCATTTSRGSPRVDAWAAARAQLARWAAHWVASSRAWRRERCAAARTGGRAAAPALRGSLTRGLRARRLSARAARPARRPLAAPLALSPPPMAARRSAAGCSQASPTPSRPSRRAYAATGRDAQLRPPARALPAGGRAVDLAHAPELLQPGLSMLGL